MKITLGEHNLYLIVGEQRCGKTTWLINNIIEKIPKSIPVFVLNPANEVSWNKYETRLNFTNISQTYFVNDDLVKESSLKQKYDKLINKFVRWRISNLRYNIVIVDDSRPLVRNNESESLFALLSFRRQIKSDMFFVFHSLRSVPSIFYTYASYLILFRTKENPFYYEGKLPLNLLEKIQNADVNNISFSPLIFEL
jgi:hypothetical protein